MRTGISIKVTPSHRRRLVALVSNRNAAQKHVWRAEIVLLSADGIGTNEIMRRTGKSKTCVWRWQERYAEEGFEGLLRDKTRPSRIAPLGAQVAERVVALALTDPPAETTHWTAAMMANQVGISVSSVQRIWRAHGLQPHRVRQFRLSSDPNFIAKLRDVVGLYVDPPAHAIVHFEPEEPRSGARPHSAGPADEEGPRRHHDPQFPWERHDHPLAALNVLERHGHRAGRHEPPPSEFIRFLDPIEHQWHSGQERPRHPRQLCRPQASQGPASGFSTKHSPSTHPTSSYSWLNAVEGFFAKLTNRRLKRGMCISMIVDLQTPSTTSSQKPTTTPGPSHGPPIQTKSSPPSSEGTKC